MLLTHGLMNRELVNGKYDGEKCEATRKGNHMFLKARTCLTSDRVGTFLVGSVIRAPTWRWVGYIFRPQGVAASS